MKKIITTLLAIVIGIASLVTFAGCSDAEVISNNISKQADLFNVYRRIVFYNSIQDVYILVIEGFCSIEVDGKDNQLEVTVKIGEKEYQKHFLGLSDNVTYTVEQLESINVSPYHYSIIFKPDVIVPIIINASEGSNP